MQKIAWAVLTFLFFLLVRSVVMAGGAGTILVANKAGNTLQVFAAGEAEPRHTLPTGQGPHEVVVSPDRKVAVVSNYGHRTPGNTLSVYDLEKGSLARVIDLGEHTRPHGLQWLEDGGVAVTTEGSRSLLVVDPASGEIRKAIGTGQDVSHMVAVTPDGKRAFVSNIGSGSVTVIDLETATKLRDVETGGGAEGIAITADGTQVWVGNRADDTISVIDAKSLEVVATLPCKGFPIRVTASPDGKSMFVSCARAGAVARFDVATRKETARTKLSLKALPESKTRLFADRFGDSPVPVGLHVSPDGARVYVATTQSDLVVIVDPASLAVVDMIATGDEPDGMAVF